ncbi:pseudouridine synthase, partial [Fragilariopsis cylindrus CCMP1102]
VIPENIPLDVLYEDHDMLVINKPSGMIMQFVSGSVERAVVSYLNSTTVSAYGTPLWPWETSTSFEGIVHRIDKETSGILVVAKHPVAAKALHESFHQRRVDKTYLAIAVGLPTTTTTTANAKQKQQTPSSNIVVNAPIGRLGTRKRLMGIVSTDDGGRDAKSIVIPLAYNGIHSLNRIVIETGRTHQIRVHMSSVLDCPLVGDPMYASTTITTNNNNDDNNYRCMLHAFELTIPHPTTGDPIKIVCDPPSDFSSLSNTI